MQHVFDEEFEKWFEEHIAPTITNPAMVFVTKSIMEQAYIAGYDRGVDVGCEISHR